MFKQLSDFPRLLVAIFVLVVAGVASGLAASANDKAPNLSPSEILAKHLEAIGTHEARADARSRSVRGTVEFSEHATGGVSINGKATVTSEGPKFACAFEFNEPQYPGEELVFDGRSVLAAAVDGQSRSRLESFISEEPEVLEEGIWGGVLATGWSLLARGAASKLRNEGIKQIDGQDLYQLTFTPRKRNSQLLIHMYFEPRKFRHVMTVYRLTGTRSGPSVKAARLQPGDPGGVTTIVEERFGDFETIAGITLPTKWEIRLRAEPANGAEYQWLANLKSVAQNPF